MVVGINWLLKNKPHINWDTSVFMVQRHGVDFQVYPKAADLLLHNAVFVKSPDPTRAQRKAILGGMNVAWKSSGTPINRMRVTIATGQSTLDL